MVRILYCAAVATLLACSPSSDVASPPNDSDAANIAGLWEVEGTTVEKGNEESKRDIRGTVTLSQEGRSYSSTFKMKTMFATPGGGASVDTDVIGTGEGTVEGRSLRGRASTQLVMASVPGVDTAFAFVPRMVTTRIVSRVKGQLLEDGTISLEIESAPAEGEQYIPTRTVLTGRRP
jgi:hypothetical protein